MGKREERIKRLTEVLKLRSYVSIRELAAILGVSEMTVRRDIKVLEAHSIAENIDGTLVYNPAHLGIRDEKQYNLLAEAEKQNPQKSAIGRYAASMVEHGESIIVDTGTTTEQIVPHLPIDKNLTVLCYNINILMELRRNPGVQMLFAGGYYYNNTQMFASDQGVNFINNIRAQKVFVSAAGVHNKLGLTCANTYEVPTKKAILRASLQKILVADSSKFGAVRPEYFGDLSVIDDIITDAGLPDEWRDIIDGLGIHLHIV